MIARQPNPAETPRFWPWEAEPYRLWSLLDMLKPWAHRFGELMSCVLDCEHTLSAMADAAELPSTQQIYIRHYLNELYVYTTELELDRGGQLLGLLGSLDPSIQEQIKGFPIPKAGDIRIRLTTFRQSLDRELRRRSFLFVPDAKAAFYEQTDLFGPQVSERFSRAAQDIKEAGTCIALDRPTAAVFHLMCVLEVGIDRLSHALGLPYKQAAWHTILNDIEKRVNALGPQDGSDWRADKEFYSQAVVEFRFFKDAWRNHVAHGRARYNEGEARNIFEHIRSFMEWLSGRLSERPADA